MKLHGTVARCWFPRQHGEANQAYLGKISCMRRNLVGDHTLLDVIPVWQAQVLLGRHIAQQSSACSP